MKWMAQEQTLFMTLKMAFRHVNLKVLGKMRLEMGTFRDIWLKLQIKGSKALPHRVFMGAVGMSAGFYTVSLYSEQFSENINSLLDYLEPTP
eukprot:c35900_g1_i1 orf=258-533(-)